jgi:hypothetical protein
VSHLDPEQLALIALGEPVASDEEREHLAHCPDCTAEVAEMAHAVVVARSTMDETELDTPPARVWGRIADELGLSDEVAKNPLTAVEPDAPAAVAEAPSAASAASTPRERPRRRLFSTRAIWMLAASVAVVLVVAGGVWAGIGLTAPVSIASATLDAFPDHPAAVGSAEVDEARNGQRTLTVTLEGDADSDDYREVWLIRNDGKALISLGVLEGSTGTFPIPAGVDLGQYDLVDISFEPVDGDPAHSGDSIVRGQLDFA